MVTLNKRTFLGVPALAALGLAGAAQAKDAPSADACAKLPAPDYRLPITKGPFGPEPGSLKTYQAPDWFRDAKFGIWAHWGPQAVPRQGDWYAKRMYLHDAVGRSGAPRQDPANAYHLEHYGHPSKFGYKDIIPLWKAEKWDPEQL